VTCRACAAAEVRVLSGQFDMNCRACRIRYCALQPSAHRQQTYSLIENEEERAAFIKDVQDYWKRRQAALKDQR